MKRPESGTLSVWLRGRQTIGHTLDLVREVLSRILLVRFLWTGVSYWLVTHACTREQQATGTVAPQASILRTLGPPFPQVLGVTHPQGRSAPYPVSAIRDLPWMRGTLAVYDHSAHLALLLWFVGVELVALHPDEAQRQAERLSRVILEEAADVARKVPTDPADKHPPADKAPAPQRPSDLGEPTLRDLS